MEQYISKSALVAEIKKKGYHAQIMSDNAINGSMRQFYDGMKECCQQLSVFLDTLEVKEVDLEKIFNDEYSKFSNDTDADDYAFPIDLADYKDFAKHFFELGMSVSNKAQKGE